MSRAAEVKDVEGESARPRHRLNDLIDSARSIDRTKKHHDPSSLMPMNTKKYDIIQMCTRPCMAKLRRTPAVACVLHGL
jgi:hypothetical protein